MQVLIATDIGCVDLVVVTQEGTVVMTTDC